MRRTAPLANSRSMKSQWAWDWRGQQNESLTFCFGPLTVDTGTGDQDIVDNGEDTLATDPRAILVLNTTVAEDRRLVEADTSAVDLTSKWNLLRMEIIPT